MKNAILPILALLMLTSCNAPKVVYDYDDQINHNQFRSVALYPKMESGLSMLDEKRLLDVIDGVLREKGLPQSSSPDLYLNIFTEQYEEGNRENLGMGISTGSPGFRVGISGGIPLGSPDQYLVIYFDLIDVDKDQLVWQAEVSRKFNPKASPEKRRAWFQRVVEKAFSKYPPQ